LLVINRAHCILYSLPTRRSSDLVEYRQHLDAPGEGDDDPGDLEAEPGQRHDPDDDPGGGGCGHDAENTRRAGAQGFEQPWWCQRSEEHTSELQSREKLVCRLLLE